MKTLIATLLVAFSVVRAQDNAAPDVPSPASRKHTVYDFGEVDISGKLKKGEGRSIVEMPDVRFKRLLDLDESFIPNLIRSVDEF